MLVRMRAQMSGLRNGREWPPRGSVIDLPDEEARQYCAAGMAEPVTTFRQAETAVPDVTAETREALVPEGLTTKTGPKGR